MDRSRMPTRNKYQVMPPLAHEEAEALRQDIAENGVQVPVVLDGEGEIIDGYHRVQAWELLKVMGYDVPDYPTIIRADLTTDDEKRELAWKLNMARRHLNQAQKRAAVAAKLKESPDWADNRIAHLLGVDHKTVRSVRNSLERSAELPKHEMLQGADKKYYPRERPGETKLQKFRRALAEGVERRNEKQVADQPKDLEDEMKADRGAVMKELGERRREREEREREEVKQRPDMLRFMEVDRALRKQRKAARETLELVRGVQFDDEAVELLGGQLEATQDTLGLVGMALGGDTDTDWDAELFDIEEKYQWGDTPH
jgi:hypothetical protein